MQDLQAKLTSLAGVGPALAGKLERLGLHRVEDLLFLLPLRYEDRTELKRLGSLKPAMRCLVSGEVLLAETVFRGRRSLLVRVGDGTGQITLRFFHFSKQQQSQFRTGASLCAFGDVRAGPLGFEMVHPEYRLLKEGENPVMGDSLTPCYPATEGVQQGRLRNLTSQALRIMERSAVPELLPRDLLLEQELPSLADALQFLHRPPSAADLASIESGRDPCRVRVAFEELLAHYLSLRDLRYRAQNEPALPLPGGNAEARAFLERLPFLLTAAQTKVIADITEDLARSRPMMRLVQGDVGSGKTVVAAVACLKAIACGVQAVVMAPTELLAEQHWHSFSDWFGHLGIEPAWLSGSLGVAKKRAVLESIAEGSARLVIGTHALFQEGVSFEKLGLVVIDEQHRFGVHQRMALRDKGVGKKSFPHQLVMTATPIPRTLAMAAYADLDVSVIDELPPGRQEVSTVAIPDTRREEIVGRVREACARGQQAYWVCPLIGESELLDCHAAEASFEMLREALPGLEVGLVHGRMKAAEKNRIMRSFKSAEIDLLVATTVIEVGVDVPNASLMIIENAERMGLSQLHQLRGRVGRGAAQSHCVLLYRPPLGPLARSRLAVLRETGDGFVVAQRDLELRGPGELLGTRQTGLPQYRIADLLRDSWLMPRVGTAANRLRRDAPQAAEAIVRRWLGDSARYGKI